MHPEAPNLLQRMIKRVISVLWLVCTATSLAANEPVYTIKIVNRQFIPVELHIPKATKVQIVLDNLDDTADEFDSHSSEPGKARPTEITGRHLHRTTGSGPVHLRRRE